MNKKTRNSIIVASLFLVLTIPIIAETAFAKPTDLPDPAKVTVAPLKVRIIEYEGLTAVFKPYYTFRDDPVNHASNVGDFNGTGKLVILRDDIPGIGTAVGCSGTLLLGGLHVLTAAHCVAGSSGNPVWKLGSNVTFTGSSGDVTINFNSTTIHPDYTGNIIRGNDIAVIKLNNTAPTEIARYDIDRNKKDDIGAVGEKVGYGISGSFADGSNSTIYPFGTKRDGLNKYDDTADTMYIALRFQPGKDFPKNSVLQYDSDNGLEENDAFDFFFRNSGLGLEDNEAIVASGDSGGSTFTTLNGDKIVTGVTSYGVTLVYVGGGTSDCHLNLQLINGQWLNVPDSSCGEFAGDTSVAMYSEFIDSVTGGGGDEPVDEPNCPANPNSNKPGCG